MTTLTSAPVAPLLDRLFADAEARHPMTDPEFADMPAEERMRLMRSKAEYRAFYARLKDYALPVSREAGRLLYMLARATRARTIVEFGTSFGVSTLHLAAALRDNGGGRLIGSEFEPDKIARARANLAEAGLADLVELREGDALDTLARDLPETIDLLLLDGAKSLYLDVLDRVAPRLRPGAVILADNADHSPDYLAHVSDPANAYLTMAYTDDVELTIRLA
ncbi:O-methyltransferase [Sphingomonas morindae]|uniref:Class I SAM-dependent methyltransferase n=1 Tax=Sphingomonas morindae TaxID=1541170 RepID=A0ABY4X935_9SPHN|nr:class I SAM-dependent methyltransferase [Sphingomonas morindae]USI73419.1 class I SAM-dependent methyltransferase [Sphingomonas morindae]